MPVEQCEVKIFIPPPPPPPPPPQLQIRIYTQAHRPTSSLYLLFKSAAGLHCRCPRYTVRAGQFSDQGTVSPPPPPPPPGPNSLGNTVPRTEFPGCTKPVNRTQFPREYSPPPDRIPFLVYIMCIPRVHARKGWHIWPTMQLL